MEYEKTWNPVTSLDRFKRWRTQVRQFRGIPATENALQVYFKRLRQVRDVDGLLDFHQLPRHLVVGGADFGGHEKETEKKDSTVTDRKSNFGGGAGAGVNITPIAFMVFPPDGNFRMMPIGVPASTAVDRAVDLLPDVLQRIQDFIEKMKDKKETKAAVEAEEAKE